MKKGLLIILIFAIGIPLTAQNRQREEKKNVDIIPIAGYNLLSLDKQTINSPGAGLAIMSGEMNPQSAEETDYFQAILLYNYHILEDKPLFSYPDSYHSIEFLLQKKFQRHQYFSLFKSYSDKPVAGGLHTFAFLSGYGYELIQTEKNSLSLGASLCVTELGLELPDGSSWPVIPLPFIHYEYSSRIADFSFDFTTSPMAELVIAPEERFRFNNSIMITDLDVKYIRDLKFDTSLEYRFFPVSHPMGDFAGLKIGFLGEDYSYDISGRSEKELQISWYAFYSTLDLSLLKVTGGYAFAGEECYSGDYTRDIGSGLYMKIQLAYQF